MKFPLETRPVHADASAGGETPAASAAEPLSPRLVIRGTSTEDGTGPRTKVDYVTVTCEEDDGAIRRCLSEVFAGAPAAPVYESGRGMRHFERSRRLVIAGVPAGFVLTGGETQRGKACIDVSGAGCSFVSDWERAEDAFLKLPARSWRRGDIAADFFCGELTHERVKQAHTEGKFNRGGRNPRLREITCTDDDQPRTIYVGERGGDTLGRFYEKGIKEFAGGASKELRRLAGSPRGVTVTDAGLNNGQSFELALWYRAELELRAKNRPIADDWISKRDEYFAGAYPFLRELLPHVEARVLVRPRDKGIIAIEKALARVKKQWGAVLFTGLAYCGGDYVALCMKVLGDKHSERLIAAGALLALSSDE